MSRKLKKLLFVVNVPEFFISHRLPLAVAARNEGYDVHIATAPGPEVEVILAHGFKHHAIPFVRSGQNPLQECNTLYRLIRLFWSLKPDLVHLVTIKPVLYGGIAARLAGVKAVVAAISGLGTVFFVGSAKARLRRWLVLRMYAMAFNQANLIVVFQNSDDRNILLSFGVVPKSETRMIRGSGVALNDYPYLPEPEGKPVVVMASRLLKDKGVFEFVEAARVLHERGVEVDMRLIGSLDPGNPTSITAADLDNWKQENNVQILGFRKDIAEQYAAANIVCLPSYYGEGLPKSLIEAAACGRAVVTTDHPGCRDAIIPSQTGLLVPVRDALELADAIQTLLEDRQLRQRMGKAGRRLAEEAFSIETIVAQHMVIYGELQGGG